MFYGKFYFTCDRSLNIRRSYINIFASIDDDALMHVSRPCDVMTLTTTGRAALCARVDETGNRFVNRRRETVLLAVTAHIVPAMFNAYDLIQATY